MSTKRGTSSIGRVVATEAMPATPHAFAFRGAGDDAVGIGAIVRVEGEDGRTVFGVVVDGRAHEDAQLLWAVSVLRQLPPEPMRPVPIGPVFLAQPEDVTTARSRGG